jgi:hypothetical protein
MARWLPIRRRAKRFKVACKRGVILQSARIAMGRIYLEPCIAPYATSRRYYSDIKEPLCQS